MIYKATQEIYDAFQMKGLKAFIQEEKEISTVYASFPMENGSPIMIRFINGDDDNDVAVRVMELMRVKPEKVKEIRSVINHLNCKYRYMKFTLDGDNDVNVEYDLPLSGGNVGACALEMTARFVDIIRGAYPELMRVVWQ